VKRSALTPTDLRALLDAAMEPLENLADPSTWSHAKLVAALLTYRRLYGDEALARRKAVADCVALREQLACRETLLQKYEREREVLG